jgi:hypothetical protein
MNVAKWRDGLYAVDCGTFHGEFTVSNGHLTHLSPCLMHAFDIFARSARFVSPLVNHKQPHLEYAKQDRKTT